VTNILLLHQGVYGHTRHICEFLQTQLLADGQGAEVRALADAGGNIARYDMVVIGASIRHGKHNPAVMDFIRANVGMLEAMPSAFFSVSLVARKPAKNTPQTNPYVKAFLANCPWKPQLVGVFGGELDYQRYGVFDRTAIRFIMRLTGGPTDPHTKVVFTNWDDVARFGKQLAVMAANGQPA
jgi:menaquinone-dependent protoporphyrinogen oxidase